MVSNYSKILPCIAFAGIMAMAVSDTCASPAAGGAPTAALYGQLEVFHGHVCAG